MTTSKKSRITPAGITDVYIFAMLAVFPLFTGFEGYSDITRSKFLFFVCVTGLWLAALVIVGIIHFDMPKPKLSAVQICVMVFALVCCVSAAVSPYGAQTIIGAGRYDGLITHLLYVAIFLGVSSTGRLREAHLWAFGAAVFVCCCVAVFQLIGYNPLWLFPDNLSFYDSGVYYTGQYLGTIGNTNVLAAYLCLAVPLLFVYALMHRGRSLFLLIPAVFACVLLLCIGVSGGVAALLGTIMLCTPIVLGKRRLFIVTGVMAVAGLVFVWLYPGQSGTIYEFSRVLHGDIQDSFGSSRIQIWRGVLELIPERPLLGGGPDTLSLRLDITFSRFVEETGKTLSTYVDNAHNEYLGHLANVGALGLLSYLTAILCSIIRFFRTHSKQLIPIGCALICYWIDGLFGIGLSLVAPMMWLLWGLFHSKLS